LTSTNTSVGDAPCVFVLATSGDADHAEVFRVPEVEVVEALDTRTNGWRDRRFNGQAVWRWNGKTYE
jgi:hypothetical protein